MLHIPVQPAEDDELQPIYTTTPLLNTNSIFTDTIISEY